MRLFQILRWRSHSASIIESNGWESLVFVLYISTTAVSSAGVFHFAHIFFWKIWDAQSNIVITLTINVRANPKSIKGFRSDLDPFSVYPDIILCGTCRTPFWREILSSAKLLIELNSLKCGFQSDFSLSLLLAPSMRPTICFIGVEVMFQIRVRRVWNGCDGKMGPEIDGQVDAPDACWGSVH